jgi:hypothetical protein
MFGRGKHRESRLRGAQFCDQCTQVCTAECRSDARRERVRTEVALWTFGR